MIYAEIARGAAQRTTAMADVSRVLGTAAARAREAGPSALREHARAPFTMIEHEPHDVEEFLRWFERTPEWRPDGNCFNRTMLGAHRLDEIAGLGAGPRDDMFAGAIHIEQETASEFLATAKTPEELERLRATLTTGEHAHLSGRFHATLALRIKGHEDPVAVDFKAKRPFLHFLADTLPERTQLIRPFAGSGVWGGASVRSAWVDDAYFTGATSFLNDAIAGSTMRIDRSAALEDAVAAVHHGAARPVHADNRPMSVRVNDEATFD